MVARGWKNGFYPNEGAEEAAKNGSKILNHTGIKMGWDDKSNRAIILDQNASRDGSIQYNLYDPKQGDWSVVNASTPYDQRPSRSDFKLDDALQKGTKDAQKDVSNAENSRSPKSP